jgi:tRNA G10  N-methylase Trm11
MGYQIYGSDISDQMISYSAENIAWLSKNYPVSSENIRLEPGDATNKRWEKPFDAIASEVYLGRAYSSYPPPEKLHQNISDTNTILEKFLINLSGQLPKGFRFCLAVPAWIDPTAKLIRLPLLDHLDKLGYNRLSFEHTKDEDLIYYRPTQFVGRELLVIIKR